MDDPVYGRNHGSILFYADSRTEGFQWRRRYWMDLFLCSAYIDISWDNP